MKFGLYSSSWWMTSLSTSHRNTDASARLSTQRRLERWQMTQRQWCCWWCNLHKNILWDLVTSDNASVKSTNASTRSRTSCKTWRRGHRPLSWYHTEWVKSLTKYESFKHESSKQRTQLVRRRPKPSPCEEWHSHPERRWLDLQTPFTPRRCRTSPGRRLDPQIHASMSGTSATTRHDPNRKRKSTPSIASISDATSTKDHHRSELWSAIRKCWIKCRPDPHPQASWISPKLVQWHLQQHRIQLTWCNTDTELRVSPKFDRN
jgi:hypothetical protein